MIRIHDDRAGGAHSSDPEPLSRTEHPLLGLQRTVGNTAVVGLLQRAADPDAPPDTLTPAMAQQLARRLRDAMEGWGTDEDAIYGVFSGRTQPQVDAVETAYRAQFDRDLTEDLHDELNASELRHLASLAPAAPAAPAEGSAKEATPALEAVADRTGRAEVAARRLRSAMEGWGTDEEAIFAVLTGRSAAERDEIAGFYALTYGRTLEADIRDEMSGAELAEAMRLLGQGSLSAADEIYQAITGAGTDESRIMRVLDGLAGDVARINGLIADYRTKYGGLLTALNGDLSGDELTEARQKLGRAGHEAACREVLTGADPDLLHQVPDFSIMTVDRRLALVRRVHTETIVGDSDEGVLERIWTAADMAEPAALNRELYRTSRDRGAEIPESLTTFGRFENRFEQDMFEGGTTVGEGLFDWTLIGDRLDVQVPINFEPASGVTVPYGPWRSQIDTTWNKYAIKEPGGRSVPVQFTMVNDSSASRTVEVVKNKIPGTLTPDDRANAGMFFEVMSASTVPHEFGHFIGLPDEYQRTHDDFIRIAGFDKVGPANASGRTEPDIADDLHTALHLEAQPTRRVQVRSLLTTVGLIVGRIPQQGDFAQDVMTEYDDAHGTLKDDLIDQLDADADRGDRWLFQTVFSYASSSVMGNPTMFGPAPHTHPVEPRHLREFVSIVENRNPAETWAVGPR